MAELLNTALFSDANLVAYYRVESGALTTDSKGAFTLTNNNTVGEDTGKYGGAADFGTANTNKSLSIVNDLGVQGGAMSFSIWVKMNTEIGSGVQTFVCVEDAGTSVFYSISYDYNAGTRRLVFRRYRQGVSGDEIYATATLGTANWHHIVLTYDATNLRGYLDNALVAGPTAFSGNGSGVAADVFAIGAFRAATSEFASIDIDDVAVFTDALSVAEIDTLYVATAGGNFFALF